MGFRGSKGHTVGFLKLSKFDYKQTANFGVSVSISQHLESPRADLAINRQLISATRKRYLQIFLITVDWVFKGSLGNSF